MNRRGPVGRGNARRNIPARIDGYREGRSKRSGVLDRLLRQLQLFDSLRREGQADQATGMLGHEIDGMGGNLLGSDDEIAFIFPVFVIHQDNELPLFNVSNRVFDAVEWA